MTVTAATDTRIVVFTKAPEPGAVKTRLIPLLGDVRAAALHQTLTDRAIATALAADIGPVTLCCAPTAQHPLLAHYCRRRDLTVSSQCDGDLGARMLHAAGNALTTLSRVIIIGSDSPAMTVADLQCAARALDDYDVVLTPAEDGGYTLIGLTRCDATLFGHIAWGGNQVMATTRERLAYLAWSWRELALSWDIDRPEDYRRLLASGIIPDLEPLQNSQG